MNKDLKIKHGFTLAEVFSVHPKDGRKQAFTLAEVLITLGIIGVVAAMTLPTLISNHRKKTFEVGFKSSVSIAQRALLLAKEELGVNSLHSYCSLYNESVYPNAKECHLTFINKIMTAASPKCTVNVSYCAPTNIERHPNDITTFNGKNTIPSDSAMISLIKQVILPNSSFMGICIVGSRIYIGIDTNGLKGPNKLGYDIFYLMVNNNDFLSGPNNHNNNITDEEAEEKYKDSTLSAKEYFTAVNGWPCNLTSNRKGNGLGCAHYALKNKCPWDETKTYWECLP